MAVAEQVCVATGVRDSRVGGVEASRVRRARRVRRNHRFELHAHAGKLTGVRHEERLGRAVDRAAAATLVSAPNGNRYRLAEDGGLDLLALVLGGKALVLNAGAVHPAGAFVDAEAPNVGFAGGVVSTAGPHFVVAVSVAALTNFRERRSADRLIRFENDLNVLHVRLNPEVCVAGKATSPRRNECIVVVSHVHELSETLLLRIAERSGLLRGNLSLSEYREQDGSQNRDDGDYDEKLNERKSALNVFHIKPICGQHRPSGKLTRPVLTLG